MLTKNQVSDFMFMKEMHFRKKLYQERVFFGMVLAMLLSFIAISRYWPIPETAVVSAVALIFVLVCYTAVKMYLIGYDYSRVLYRNFNDLPVALKSRVESCLKLVPHGDLHSFVKELCVAQKGLTRIDAELVVYFFTSVFAIREHWKSIQGQ